MAADGLAHRAVIEVDGLRKVFRSGWFGRVEAVRDASFVVPTGKVTGLLGANGAGKTTTLRMLSTVLRPSGGRAMIDGIDVVGHAAEVRRRLGFLSTNTGLYGRLSPREVLHFFGRIHGLCGAKLTARVDELVERLQLSSFQHRPCDKLSTGMKQRTNLARCLLHDPAVLILDEPTLGLDVLSARLVIGFIGECRAAGHTVLLSTHILSEVERLCDEVVLMHEGRVIRQGSVAAMRDDSGSLEPAVLAAMEPV